MKLRASWRWLVPLALLIPISFALWLAWDRPPETLGPFYGLRLGIAPAQAREQFRPGAPGSFRGEVMGEDFALVWSPASPVATSSSVGVRAARLEFHSAQLMALRLTLADSAPEAAGPPFELTELTLLTRERTPSGVELTWIARSCPVHAAEVRRRMNEHR